MNLKRCYKNLNGVILMILLYSAFASEMSKNAVFLFLFSFYRMRKFQIMVVSRASRATGAKVQPVSKAPKGLLVPLALR